MLLGVDDFADLVDPPADGHVVGIGLDVDLPGPLFGGQLPQQRQILFVGVGQHQQAAEIGNLEQVLAGIDDVADVEILFHDHAVDRRADIGFGPAAFGGRIGVFAVLDAFGFLMDLGNFSVGQPPGAQRSFGFGDIDQIGLIIAVQRPG